MVMQWKGGCINCGKPRWTEEDCKNGVDTTIRNVYLLRDKGQKTIVGMCQECYDLIDYDLEKLRDNLYASEVECAKERCHGNRQEFDTLMKFVQKFKELDYIGFQK